MQWFSQHTILAVFIGIFLLLVGGYVLISDKLAVAPGSGSVGAFGGQSGNLNDVLVSGQNDRGPDAERAIPTAINDKFVSLIPKTNVYESTRATTSNEKPITFEEDELSRILASLQSTAQFSGETAGFGGLANDDSSLEDIYSFVPAEVAATSTVTQNRRTSQQDDLFEYANEAGSYIERYAERWKDQTTVLRRFYEDRSNSAHADEVLQLAAALERVGTDIRTIDPALIPQGAATLNSDLGKKYETIGQNLAKVVGDHTDEELLEIILAYNASVDDLAKTYIAVATLLQVAGLEFTQDESGRVFQFTPTQSLGS